MNTTQTLPDLIADAHHHKKTHSRTPSTSSGQFSEKERRPVQSSRPSVDSVGSQTSTLAKISLNDNRPFTLLSPVQSIVSACTDPQRSRTETSVFFTRHWGENFLPGAHLPPPPSSASLSSSKQKRKNDEVAATQHIIVPYLKHHGKKLHQHKKSHRIIFSEDRPVPTRSTYDLSAIPQIFLRSDFNLTNRATFEEVFMTPSTSNNPFDEEHTDDETHSHHKKRLAFVSKESFNEKLEQYNDLIEQKLNKQLASKSKQFFTAVDTYNALAQQLRDTASSVHRLRTMITTMNSGIVNRSFRALSLYRARQNHELLIKKLRQCTTVREAQMTVQCFLSIYDYPSALDIISTTQAILTSDLDGALCFRHLGTQLNELHKMIARILQEEFVRLLKQHLQTTETDMEEQQLNGILIGLMRVKEYRFVHVLAEEAAIGGKLMVRRVVHQCANATSAEINGDHDDDDDRAASPTTQASIAGSSLADDMRRLSYTEWLDLLRQLLGSMLRYQNKVAKLHAHILDLVKKSASRHRTPTGEMVMSQVDALALEEQLRPMMSVICDAVEDRLARVIHARAKDGFLERLQSNEYASIVKQISSFVDQMKIIREESMRQRLSSSDDTLANTELEDELSAKGLIVRVNRNSLASQLTSPLETCMRAHSLAFVNRFHADRRQKLTNIIDTEQWKPAQVPHRFQRIADFCRQNAVLSERRLRLTSTCSIEDDRLKADSPTPPTEALIVDDQKFVVAGTALLLLRMLAQYCDCAELLPSVTSDILSRLIELLKMFNSRCCQLILGAGAIPLLGLRTITVRHLALASRCLQLITKYMPVAEKQFSTILLDYSKIPPPQLKHMSSLMGDYRDHVNEIDSKLTTIADLQLTAAIQKWPSSSKIEVPSATFQQIGKHMTRLYENVKDILSEEHVKRLMLAVHENFKRALRSRLLELDITQRDTNTYGLVCSEFSYYMEVVTSLPPCKHMEDTMTNIMKINF